MMMTKLKWLSLLVSLALLLGYQTNVQAVPAQERRDPEIIRQLILQNPTEFYRPNPLPLAPAEPSWDPNQPMPSGWSRLAYQSFRNDNWDLYLVHPSGASESRLTSHPAVENYPSLAKGGQQVVFSSNRNGTNDIFLENADGSGLVALVSSPANEVYPVWAPDSSRIAYQSNQAGNFDIYVLGPGGSTRLTSSSAYDGEPAWSPDGIQIAFVSNRSGKNEIWTMNADGSNPHQLTTNATAATPAWSPLGTQIAYANDHDGDGFYNLFLMNADGTNPTWGSIPGNFCYDCKQDQWNPAWSPDGKWLAVVRTNWNRNGENWYWYSSSITFSRVENSYNYEPFSDNLIWKVSWATTDATPPESCAVNLSPYQSWESFFVSWSAFDSPAGVSTYDVQVRDLPSGAWRDFLVDSPRPSGIFAGQNGQAYEFRCRARDWARNFAGWETTTPQATEIETGLPSSQVSPLPRYVRGSQVTINWKGSAAAGGVASYDIFVQEGEQGEWTPWLSATTAESAVFSGTPGHTYAFRSQARDLAGRVQVWQPEPQAMTTFFGVDLTVQAADNRGSQLPAPNLSLAPPAILEDLSQSPFENRYRTAGGPTSLSGTVPGFGALPNTTLSLTQDQALTFILPPVDDILLNGGFETGSLSGWTVFGDGLTLSSPVFHTGQSAARLAPGSGGTSGLDQTLQVAAALKQPTLSFLYYFADNPGGAEFSVEIAGGAPKTVLSTQAASAGWAHVWADLTDYAGQEITLRFRLSGPAATLYLDDITLGSWQTPLIQSVTPSQWQAHQVQTLTLAGQNFAAAPRVFLNQLELANVEWLDANHVTARTLPGMLGGSYDLRLINPDGSQAILPGPLQLGPLPLLIPLVAKPAGPPAPVLPSDWLTLGKDNHHSGYAPNQAGASRYGMAWSANLKGATYATTLAQVTAASGVAVAVQSSYQHGGGIYAYDLSTGLERWHVRLDGIETISPASIANGAVFFEVHESNGTTEYCLDLYTGRILWKVASPISSSAYFHPLPLGQKLYLGSGRNLNIYDAASGRLLNYNGEGASADTWAPVEADGKIYTWIAKGSWPYSVIYFSERDPVTAASNWTLELNWTGYNYSMVTAPVISGRTAFGVSGEFLGAIDLDTHALRWASSGDYRNALPAAAGDVVYAINNQTLEARRISTGELTCSFTAPAQLLFSPVISGSDVYVSTQTAAYVLDRASLQIKWTAPVGGWLTLTDGYLLIAGSDGTLTAYRAQENK